MKKEIIKKKMQKVNEWVIKARKTKDWATYEMAVREYTRLAKILENM
jgi:hypothetical protein